jgi:hypothetical protein
MENQRINNCLKYAWNLFMVKLIQSVCLNEGEILQSNHKDNICLVFKLEVDFIK